MKFLVILVISFTFLQIAYAGQCVVDCRNGNPGGVCKDVSESDMESCKAIYSSLETASLSCEARFVDNEKNIYALSLIPRGIRADAFCKSQNDDEDDELVYTSPFPLKNSTGYIPPKKIDYDYIKFTRFVDFEARMVNHLEGDHLPSCDLLGLGLQQSEDFAPNSHN